MSNSTLFLCFDIRFCSSLLFLHSLKSHSLGTKPVISFLSICRISMGGAYTILSGILYLGLG